MAEHSADDLSVGERLEHVHGGPLAWTLVVLICAGFVVGGIGLIEATPWLFYLGVGVVAVATIVGWLTHSLSEATTSVTPIRSARELSNSPENPAHS